MNTGVKVALGVTAGAIAGVALANYLTDGAVLSAMTASISTIKDKTINAGTNATEKIRNMAENAADTVANV